MKSKDKKVLLVGAGAVGLLALAVYASQGAGAEPLNLGGGGGVAGGGMPAVFAGGVDGTGEGTGQAPVTYSVVFPDVKIPAMPAYSIPSDGGTSEPRTSTKKETTMTESVQLSTGETQAVNIVAAPGGFHTVAPATTWKGTDAGYTAVTGSKKSETVGADSAPGGLPGLIGGLIGGIGGLFGW